MPSIRPAGLHLLAVAVAVTSIALLAPPFVRTTLKFTFYTILLPLLITVFILSATLLAVFVAATRANNHTPPTPFPTLQAHATRPLVFATPQQWPKTLSILQATPDRQPPSDPLTARLDSILRLIRISFILPWYAKISPSPCFPDAVDKIIHHAVFQATSRLKDVDWPTIVVARMLPIITAHFEHFKSIQHLASPLSTNSLRLPLPKNAHPALTSRHVSADADLPLVEAHLRAHVARLLPILLPEATQSPVVMVMVREIALGAVVMPVFQMLCDPDFWNRQINEQGAKYIHEKNQISKVLSALSTIPQPGEGSPRRKAAATITIHSTIKEFDDFMRSIPKLKSLGDARRLRSDVDRELRSAKGNKYVAVGEDKERAARRVQRYIHRLERARGQIDRRIAALSGTQVTAPSESPVTRRVKVNLYAVIANPACLAYWLEFMERRGRSHLVQFWLTVEGFKDPLEAMGSLGKNDLDVRDSTAGEDIAFLHSTYFTSEQKITISPRLLETITDLAQRDTLEPEDVRRAKRAINDAQKAVYLQMEEDDWPAFQQTELYLKALAEMKNSVPKIRTDRAVSYSPPASPTVPLTPLLNMRSSSDTARRPYLVNGSFTPAAPTPVTATSTSPEIVRRVSGDMPTINSSNTTPPKHRQSIHLDALFGAEDSSERNPLFADASDDEDVVQAERMSAIQAALNEIIAEDAPRREGQTPEPVPEVEPEVDPLSFSVPALPSRHPLAGNKLTSRSADDLQAEKERHESPARPVLHYDVARRRLARRGSSGNLRPTKSIFADSVDETDDNQDENEELSPDVQLAAPGDLQLCTAISQLDSRIGNLLHQEDLLSSLIRQAELTGNQKELRLLERSQSSLQRERRTAEFQAAQFRRQEEENRLDPSRTRVRIPSTTVSDDNQIVRYQVEISQVQEGRTVLSWTVSHRYSEFWDLDRTLRDSPDPRIHSALSELPGKRLVTSQSSAFLEARRSGLERYLETLVSSPILSQNNHVRNFLSHSPSPTPAPPLAPHKLVQSLYKSVASSYDSGPSMIDLMSQSLSRQLVEVAGDLVPALRALNAPTKKGSNSNSNPITPVLPQQLPLPPAMQPLEGEGPGGFTAPICDLFIEVFDLKENWVRRQAIVIILQQVLGGTIERKFRDSLRTASEPAQLERLLQVFQDALWPGGERRPPSEPRTQEEILETKAAAARRVGTLIPDVAANMMGRGNVRRAASVAWGSVQDARMNQHLVLSLIDEIFAAL